MVITVVAAKVIKKPFEGHHPSEVDLEGNGHLNTEGQIRPPPSKELIAPPSFSSSLPLCLLFSEHILGARDLS